MFRTKPGAAGLSVASNSLLILLKTVAGILTGSIAILAEAIHSLLDLAAAIIALLSVRVSDKPADKTHPFGHGKIENLSGVVEGGLIFVAAGIIIYEAIQRLTTGARVELLEIGIVVMAVSIGINVIVSRHLLKVSRSTDSIALEADARHLTTDVLTSLGVLLGLVLVRVTGLNFLDPIVALIVAVLIIKAAFEVTRKSYLGLMDTKLPSAEEEEIISSIMKHTGEIVSVHQLRTRKSGSQRHIDLHLVMPKYTSVEEAHRMCDHLERHIKDKLSNANITIHVEPCDGKCQYCSIICRERKENNQSRLDNW